MLSWGVPTIYPTEAVCLYFHNKHSCFSNSSSQRYLFYKDEFHFSSTKINNNIILLNLILKKIRKKMYQKSICIYFHHRINDQNDKSQTKWTFLSLQTSNSIWEKSTGHNNPLFFQFFLFQTQHSPTPSKLTSPLSSLPQIRTSFSFSTCFIIPLHLSPL